MSEIDTLKARLLQLETTLARIRACPEAEIVHNLIDACATTPAPTAPADPDNWWLMTYAYDIPCFFDFAVQADSEAEALAKMQAALAAGLFSGVTGKPDHSEPRGDRVFSGGAIDAEEAPLYQPLAELLDSAPKPMTAHDWSIASAALTLSELLDNAPKPTAGGKAT